MSWAKGVLLDHRRHTNKGKNEMTTTQITKIENREARENEAYNISKKLDSMIRFSNEWCEYIQFVEAWTKVNGALYATYNED
jgi:hypothetical protein